MKIIKYLKVRKELKFKFIGDGKIADVRDQIVFKADDYFSSGFSWLTEFEVWNIRDEKGDDEWSL